MVLIITPSDYCSCYLDREAPNAREPSGKTPPRLGRSRVPRPGEHCHKSNDDDDDAAAFSAVEAPLLLPIGDSEIYIQRFPNPLKTQLSEHCEFDD